MSNKTNLTNAELELTQKIQLHFPRGIDPDIVNVWNGQPKEVITAAAMEIFSRMPTKPSILEFVGTVKVPETTGKFVAKDHFVVDMSDKAKVKIWSLGSNFEKWFLDKVEEPISETVLGYHNLRKSSVDGPIINELGGEEKAEIILTEIFALMERQSNGEKGDLLTNGYANIFYIRDTAGVLRAVYCYWYGFGWSVHAYSVGFPLGWVAGVQVFSRNSKSLEPKN